VDFASTRSNADGVARTTDVAELLVSTAIVVGNERAVDAAFTALGSDALVDALPYVQRAALNPWLRAQARAAKFDLDELRSQAAQRAGVKLPAIQPLRRLNLRDIAFMVLIGVAAYILITGLLDIGIDNIIDALSEADLAWVLLALFISQFTYFGNAFAMQGAVGQPIPFGPVVVLQAAIKFINLTVPTMAGRIALNTRFLQKLGVPLAVALTQGGIDGIAGTIVQVVLFLSVLPFIDVTLDTTDQDGNILAIIGIVAVVALVVGIAFVVLPVLRRKILPYLKAAWDNAADVMHQPSRIGHLLAGNVAVELLYALTLGACCRAYGIEISLTELLFINIAVTVFAGIIPVPGGIGVAEAGLTAGLMLFGVPEAIAFAAALTHRLVTYYVPPAWGWIALRWLGKHGYV
jgi:uncharacterized membrane protein YbhN (UPF0104 family)